MLEGTTSKFRHSANRIRVRINASWFAMYFWKYAKQKRTKILKLRCMFWTRIFRVCYTYAMHILRVRILRASSLHMICVLFAYVTHNPCVGYAYSSRLLCVFFAYATRILRICYASSLRMICVFFVFVTRILAYVTRVLRARYGLSHVSAPEGVGL